MWIQLTKEEVPSLVAILNKHHEGAPFLERLALYQAIDEDPDSEAFRATAQDLYYSDFEIDMVDDDAVVSRSDDGAYVHLWGWVSNEAAGLSEDDDEHDDTCEAGGGTGICSCQS